MEKKGTIIAFEGLDNSFKETNCTTFALRLSEEKWDYMTYYESFPRYNSEWSFAIKKWLNGSIDREYLKSHPKLLCSFYASDRMAYWHEPYMEQDHNYYKYIDNYINDKCYFVFDRYDSSKIYNTLSGGMPTLEDFTFDRDFAGNPVPDITVVMRMGDFSVLEDLIKEKENKDLNETDIEFLKNTWDKLEYAINNELFQKAGSKLVVVNCLNDNGSIKGKKEIADFIWEEVTKLLEY